MIWNKYSLKLFIYLLILSLIGFGFFWSLYSGQLIITNIVFVGVFILFFFSLLQYLNKTNRDLNQFLASVNFLDNLPVKTTTDLSHGQLNLTYNKIVSQLKDAWVAKEQEHQYFKYVLKQIGIGIITHNKNGDVEIYNNAAKAIFGFENLKNISQLDSLKIGLSEELKEIKPENTKLLKFEGALENIKILVRATEVKIENRKLKLLSFQNIKTQLEQSELEAWQKLIRVLTHEIMNSVTPIKSLTYSMQKNVTENEDLNIENLSKGLKAIENRSKGLLDFVESYKNLTQIPKPNYERVQIDRLFIELESLFKDDFWNENIQFKKELNPNDLSVIADKKLISQVLINLLNNSIYALKGQREKEIKIIAEQINANKICIKVFDNGKGIPEDVKDKIFVPFYTTRINGSGIGLSFVRQVMLLHNGTIEVNSRENKGTVFALCF